MANTLTPITHKILARGLRVLRQRCIMPQLVNSDYGNDARKKGATVDVPIPTAVGVRDVTPASTKPAGTDTATASVSITLEKWRQNDPIYLTDKQMAEIDAKEHFLPMQLMEAVSAIASDINANILDQYKGVYGYVGTAGTTPFASNTDLIVDARAVMNLQKCPLDSRRFVMDFNAEANAMKLASFADVSQTGEDGVKINGIIGRKYGFDWAADDQIPLHTSTPLTAGAATVNGTHAAAPTALTSTVSIAKATNASDLVVGDIVTFAGDTQTYVVTAAVTLAVGNTNVVFAPGLKVAKSGGEAMTLKASHRVNLAFHRDAFAFANRPLEDAMSEYNFGGSHQAVMQDAQTGLTMRLEVTRVHKQVLWEFDVLWGAKLVRPELAVRLAG